MRKPRLLLTLLALLAPLQARAQPAEQDILVTGERDRAGAVHQFVESVTLESDDQIARFATPVCPASFGLAPAHNEVVAERLRLIARHVGIPVAEPDCRPNLVVVVTDGGERFFRELRRERPLLFTDLELSDVRAMMRLEGPVRAWQLVLPHGADGRPLERIAWLQMGNGPPRYIPHGYRLPGVMPSLNQRPTRQDLMAAFVVFDLDAVEGLTLLQIADHAAMRAFARTASAGLPPRRSILTLFAERRAGGAPAEELTGWDEAYLRALYRGSNALSAHRQRANVARTMRRELARPATE